jgi:hypothetical protein
VLGRLLRTAGLIACVLVTLSWLAFATDELRDASNRSTEQVQGREAARTPDPSTAQESDRERAHTRVREALDDADDVLVLPFAGLVSGSGSAWVRRTVPLLLALLLYGLVAGYLARFLQVH